MMLLDRACIQATSLPRRSSRPSAHPAIVLAVGMACVAASTAAADGAFTDAAAFADDLGGSAATFDFEALAPGTVLSGATLAPANGAAGIRLPDGVDDVLAPGGASLVLRVVENSGENPASSGARTLGVLDPGNFDAITAGTPLQFVFSPPVSAFGLTIVTPEEPGAALFDGDARLVVAGEPTASLSLADGQALGSFGGRAYRAYFLGVVATGAFANATLDYGAGAPVSGFFFNLDDLRIPVPEPGAVPMMIAGVLAIGTRAAGRRRFEVSRPTRRASKLDRKA